MHICTARRVVRLEQLVLYIILVGYKIIKVIDMYNAIRIYYIVALSLVNKIGTIDPIY